MWELDHMAQRYSQRPSTFLAIDDPVIAFDLDRAVSRFGTWFDDVRQETIEVPAETKQRRKPTVMKPKHSKDDLKAMLGFLPPASTVRELTAEDKLNIADEMAAFLTSDDPSDMPRGAGEFS